MSRQRPRGKKSLSATPLLAGTVPGEDDSHRAGGLQRSGGSAGVRDPRITEVYWNKAVEIASLCQSPPPQALVVCAYHSFRELARVRRFLQQLSQDRSSELGALASFVLDHLASDVVYVHQHLIHLVQRLPSSTFSGNLYLRLTRQRRNCFSADFWRCVDSWTEDAQLKSRLWKVYRLANT